MEFPSPSHELPDHPHGVLLVRHGLTQWNADGRWQGWADIPLSDLGRRQAEFAARTLARVLIGRDEISAGIPYDVRVVSSDLQRAAATAKAFAEALGVTDVEQIGDLRERNVGDWAGLTSREISLRWPGLIERWRSGEQVMLPGGEDETGFRTRILRTLTTLVRTSAEEGRRAVVVSHGGAMRTIESLLGLDARHIANVGGRWFYWDGDRIEPGVPVDLLDDAGDLDQRAAHHPVPGGSDHQAHSSSPGQLLRPNLESPSDERSANAAL